LDVGCGTAILSIFCAQAGARKVYGIEASDIVDYASQIVFRNNLQNKITLFKGLVEEITLPEPVDIIISEWMGYFLLYEAMFNTVLCARDRWLKPDGKVYPSQANLYLACYSDEEYVYSKIDFWKNVYGVDMSPIISFAKYYAFYPGCVVDTLKGDTIISNSVLLRTIECRTVTLNQLDETIAAFEVKFTKSCDWQGFVGWFDVLFGGDEEAGRDPVVLSTAPGLSYTHWHHTLFVFEQPFVVQKDQTVMISMVIIPHPQAPRHLQITVDFMCNDIAFHRVYDF